VSRPLGSTELKRLHREWRRRTDTRLALLLDGVQGPFNLGAIARSAAAYGVTTVWAAGTEVPSVRGPKAQKTAMGTDRYLDWRTGMTVGEALAQARAEGYRLVGVELAEGAGPLFAARLTGDVCLMLGHEDRGLGRVALEACDEVAFLPLVGKVGSLNVATAAAVALYDARRQHWSTP